MLVELGARGTAGSTFPLALSGRAKMITTIITPNTPASVGRRSVSHHKLLCFDRSSKTQPQTITLRNVHLMRIITTTSGCSFPLNFTTTSRMQETRAPTKPIQASLLPLLCCGSIMTLHRVTTSYRGDAVNCSARKTSCKVHLLAGLVCRSVTHDCKAVGRKACRGLPTSDDLQRRSLESVTTLSTRRLRTRQWFL